MKKKIGFIDLFIDEWHANNYPAWFRDAARGGEFELAMAWEEAPAGGRPLARWCADNGICAASSLAEVVDRCDVLCVLSPSNSEAHERLAELPLASGKPVYIDKPFAPSRAAAERLFARADRYGSPLFSSSALRFGTELQAALPEFSGVDMMMTRGGGRSFQEYCIHQVEMIVAAMGVGIGRVMQCGSGATNHTILEYRDGRRATMSLSMKMPFAATVSSPDRVWTLDAMSGFFPALIDRMLDFYATGVAPVDRRETIEIAAVVDSAIQALKQPDRWLEVK